MGSPHHWIPQMAAEVLVDTAPTSCETTLTPAQQHWCVSHTGTRLSWQLRVGVSLPKKKKEIADINYYFAILNILALIWPIWTLRRVWIKFTMVSSKSSGKYFLGSEEETWPHKELHRESASPRCLSPHTLKGDHYLLLTIQPPLQQETDPQP